MAGRIRTIKPELIEDAVTAGLSDSAFRVFIAMILLADDYGNLRGEPRYLDGQIYWSAVPEKSVAESCKEDGIRKLVTFYYVRGQLYAHINNWSKHQKVQHPGKPRVPSPSEDDSGVSLVFSGEIREPLTPDLRPPTTTTTTTTTTTVNETAPAAPGSLSPDEETRVRTISSRPPPPSAQKPDPTAGQVTEVLQHWADKLHPGQSVKFDDKRKKRIRARLAEKFSVDDLKKAVDGSLRDDWLMGRKDGTPKNGWRGVETIFRDAEQVERLMGLCPKPAPGLPRNDDQESERGTESTGVRRLVRNDPGDVPLSLEEQGKRAATLAGLTRKIGGGAA